MSSLSFWFMFKELLPRQDRHGRGGGIVLEVAAPVFGERDLRSGDLALAAATAELIGELHELRASGRADGLALGLQAAARVDRHAAAERGRPGAQQRRRAAGLTQPELLADDQFG